MDHLIGRHWQFKRTRMYLNLLYGKFISVKIKAVFKFILNLGMGMNLN